MKRHRDRSFWLTFLCPFAMALAILPLDQPRQAEIGRRQPIRGSCWLSQQRRTARAALRRAYSYSNTGVSGASC